MDQLRGGDTGHKDFSTSEGRQTAIAELRELERVMKSCIELYEEIQRRMTGKDPARLQ